MTQFIHHPDGYIVIGDSVYPIGFWNIVEQGYSISGYIGRIYEQNKRHHLIANGNDRYDQSAINDAKMNYYISRKADYDTAYAQWMTGAYVENIGGVLTITGPPVLSLSLDIPQGYIQANGADLITVTCDVQDAGAGGVINWQCHAPDGTPVLTSDNLVAGIDAWPLTTTHIGYHTVSVDVPGYGTSSIVFEGV